ncbi:MAG: class I SAM-dependent methyltransferase [Sedimentisphaerales bacterium]|jgi:SAM-dependent methyltransferase|nr:class I SAM-dependent methyltransferase [Sedimentisphaerales bacterium]
MNTTSVCRSYFEQPAVWEEECRDTNSERQRFEEVLQQIPIEVQTLLDVGCGSGIFVNACKDHSNRAFRRIVGVDISTEALKSVSTEKYHCTGTDLPFVDHEFDLVTSLEVLEHIASGDFARVLKEIVRVARKYVLVTVPNKEDLCQHLVICRECFCCFNPWYHVRSFGSQDMRNLFPEFELIECRPIGPVSERFVYHPAIKGASLLYRRPAMPPNTICPQCGYHQSSLQRFAAVATVPGKGRVVGGLVAKGKRLISSKSKMNKWLLALYQRREYSC